MAKFRLDTALDVRGRMEKLKQKEFAQEVQVMQGIKDRIEEIDGILASNLDAINSAKRDGFTIAQLQFYQHFKDRMLKEREVQEQELAEQKQVMERKRDELVEATQKKRVLEILKEKHFEREKKKAEKLEQFQMDEIAQHQRFARRNDL